MSHSVEAQRVRKISKAQAGGSVLRLPPLDAQGEERHRRVSDWGKSVSEQEGATGRRVSQWTKSSMDGPAKRNSAWYGPLDTAPPGVEFQSPSRIYSDNPPATVAAFLRPDFRKGYVFGYSLVVSAVLQRYSRFVEASGDSGAIFEQNPAEVCLHNVTQIYKDKLFMKQQKERDRQCIERRAKELAARSSDTFVTQTKQSGRLESTSSTKITLPNISQKPQRPVVKKRLTANAK